MAQLYYFGQSSTASDYTSVSAPLLTSVGGTVTVYYSYIQVIDMPLLQTVSGDLYIYYAQVLETLNMPKISYIGGYGAWSGAQFSRKRAILTLLLFSCSLILQLRLPHEA